MAYRAEARRLAFEREESVLLAKARAEAEQKLLQWEQAWAKGWTEPGPAETDEPAQSPISTGKALPGAPLLTLLTWAGITRSPCRPSAEAALERARPNRAGLWGENPLPRLPWRGSSVTEPKQLAGTSPFVVRTRLKIPSRSWSASSGWDEYTRVHVFAWTMQGHAKLYPCFAAVILRSVEPFLFRTQ